MAADPIIEADLWPDNLTDEVADSEPLRILRAQADALTRKTNGRLIGFVKEHLVPHKVDFQDPKSREAAIISADLLARIADGSEFTISIINIFYPIAAPDPEKPYPIQSYNPSGDGQGGEWVEIRDGLHFRTWLTGVLSSPRLQSMIARMLKFSSVAAHLNNS